MKRDTKKKMAVPVFGIAILLLSLFIINVPLSDSSGIDTENTIHQNTCEIGEREYTVDIHIKSYKNDRVDANLTLEFNSSVNNLQINKYGGEYTDLDTAYYYTKGRFIRKYDKSQTRSGSRISFNATFTMDDGYYLTGIHNRYTVIRPTLEFSTANTTQFHNQKQITKCIRNIQSPKTDRTVNSSAVNEDMILLSHTEPQIESYDIDFGNGGNITVVGHSSGGLDIEFVAETISNLETKFRLDGNRDVTMYILDGIDSSPIGYAYTGIPDTTYLYVQNDYHSEDNSIGLVGHEWLHSMQNYSYYENASWSSEGLAEYIGGLAEVNADGGRIQIVQAIFNFGWYNNSTNVTLIDESSWVSNAEYNRGSRVSYLTDRAIRNHTDNNKTIIDLVRRMNSIKGPVSHEDILGLVDELAGRNFRQEFQKYITTNSSVDIESVKIPYMKDSEYHITECIYRSSVKTISECN